MDCICVCTAHMQSINIQCIYSPHTVNRHTGDTNRGVDHVRPVACSGDRTHPLAGEPVPVCDASKGNRNQTVRGQNAHSAALARKYRQLCCIHSVPSWHHGILRPLPPSLTIPLSLTSSCTCVPIGHTREQHPRSFAPVAQGRSSHFDD